MLAFFYYFTAYPIWYWLILGIGMVLSLWASSRVKSTFQKWSQVGSRSGLNGAQVARAILQANGIQDVQVEPIGGNLTDHYDPRNKVLRLSEPVYHQSSIAALGVAAHEVVRVVCLGLVDLGAATVESTVSFIRRSRRRD